LLPNTSSPIELIGQGYEVSELVEQLQNPHVWDLYPARRYGPHSKLSDCWCRFNAWEHYDPEHPERFVEEHESVWYPVIDQLPALKPLVFSILTRIGAIKLAGVLITRIPAREICKPHKDRGWHALQHEKIALSLQANERQAFCFEEKELRTRPGDLFTFDNSRMHWVVNDSDEPRMTLIMNVRRALCPGV
jgi:Aspartyl/Asparaginyl beta-hydroxylase